LSPSAQILRLQQLSWASEGSIPVVSILWQTSQAGGGQGTPHLLRFVRWSQGRGRCVSACETLGGHASGEGNWGPVTVPGAGTGGEMGGDPSAPVWNHTPPSAMARPVGHCLPRWEPEDLGPKVQERGATAPVRSMYVSKGQAHMCRAVRCCGILLLKYYSKKRTNIY